MVLVFDENGMVDRKQLDNNEKKVFIAFLKSEINRHKKDIDDINDLIGELQQIEEIPWKGILSNDGV